MRLPLLLTFVASTASAQDFFSNDKMVREPQGPPFDMTMVREPTSQPYTDNNVREPSSEPIDPNWAGHTDADGHYHHKRRRDRGPRDSGFSISIQGGGFGRGRTDLAKIGEVLGPAGNPSAFGGMFVLQITADLKKYMRLGGDFTYSAVRAFGVGGDAGGTQVRQSVGYGMITGGFLFEGVLPVREILEFSLGASIGGGQMKVEANSSRVESFSDIGTDLRSIAKNDRMEINAPVLHIKPAFGVRARFTRSAIAAFDVRVGANIYWVPSGTMRMWDDLQLYGSPTIVEIQPFITAGIAFGDWAAR